MRTVLCPGGIVVIDQGQTDASMKSPALYDIVATEPDFTRVLVMTYDADIMTVRVVDCAHVVGCAYVEDYVHTEDQSAIEVSEIQLKIRLRADWEQLFELADFTDVEYSASLDGAAYDDQAERLIAMQEA